MGCVELLVVILLGGVEGGSGGSGGRTKFAAGFTGEFDFVFDFVFDFLFLFHDSCVLFLYSTRAVSGRACIVMSTNDLRFSGNVNCR